MNLKNPQHRKRSQLFKTTILFTFFSLYLLINSVAQNTYYVSVMGSDINNGTSESTPWKTLNKVSNSNLIPGDKVLFKSGETFVGQLAPTYSGSKRNPIEFSSYGTGAKPIIKGDGAEGGDHLAAIFINNQEYFRISNLEIQNERTVSRPGVSDQHAFGIYVLNDGDQIMNHFDFSLLTIQNIYAITTSGVDFNNLMVAGIYFRTEKNTVPGSEKHIRDVWVDNSYFTRTGKFGFWSQHKNASWGLGNDSINRNMNFVFTNNHFYHTGGPGITPGRTYNVLLENNIFDHPGSDIDPRMAKRGSGAWFYKCMNVVAQHNKTYSARGEWDAYGMHIDMGNKYVIFQYNYSEDNEGFVEILSDNKHVGYRYNISVNDGLRKLHGDTFLFSDHLGNKSDSVYVYNNTIYVGNSMTPGINLVCKNSTIANNIIYAKNGATIGVKKYHIDPLVQVNNNLYCGTVNSDFINEDANAIVEKDPLYMYPGALKNPLAYKLVEGSPAIGAAAIMDNEIQFPEAGKGIFANITANATEDYFGNPVDLTITGANIGAYNGPGEPASKTGLIYEAEKATLLGTADIKTCDKASGGKMVKTFAGIENGIDFTGIKYNSDSVVDLKISYYSITPSSLSYQINDENPVIVPLPASGSQWCYQGGAPGDYTFQITTHTGENNITIFDSPIIDKIELYGEVTISPKEDPIALSFEAENATILGTGIIYNCSNGSGGKLVKKLTGDMDNAVLFNSINVESEGLYGLSIYYMSKNAITGNININGETRTVNLPSSGGWCYEGGIPAEHLITIPLNAGYNSIKVSNLSQLDKIMIHSNSLLKSTTNAEELIPIVKSNSFTISPTAVHNGEIIRIEAVNEESFTVELYDYTGRKLIQSQSDDQLLQLETHSLKKGMYIILIYSSNTKETRKVMIK